LATADQRAWKWIGEGEDGSSRSALPRLHRRLRLGGYLELAPVMMHAIHAVTVRQGEFAGNRRLNAALEKVTDYETASATHRGGGRLRATRWCRFIHSHSESGVEHTLNLSPMPAFSTH